MLYLPKLIFVKIGLIKEGKTPPDKRVPLSPKQCKWVLDNYKNIELVVQRSPIRKYQDQEYIDDCLLYTSDAADE